MKCNCKWFFDVRCLCKPQESSWKNCPEKYYYTAWIMHNNYHWRNFNWNNINHIDELKKEFNLSEEEIEKVKENWISQEYEDSMSCNSSEEQTE